MTLSAQSAAVITVLLPVVGVVARWLAFSVDPSIAAPLPVAIAAPLGMLAVNGVFAFSIAVAPVIAEFAGSQVWGGRSGRDWLRHVPTWALPILVFLGFIPQVVLLLILPGWPISLIFIATLLLLSGLTERRTRRIRRDRRVRLADLLPSILGLLLAASIYGGFTGVADLPGLQPGVYEFASPGRGYLPHNGFYYRIGAESEMLYLRECSSNGLLYGVPMSRTSLVVLSMPAHARPAPSLWDVLVHDEQPHLGTRYPCTNR